ncbi:hypothetical protein Tco_1419532 [Tanacetum coccineum]
MTIWEKAATTDNTWKQSRMRVVVSGAKKPWGIQLLRLGLRMYLNFLMIHCLQEFVDLEKTKTSQAQEIASLKRRVKRLEKKGGSRTHGLKRLYKIGLSRRVESSDEEGLGEEDASKQGRIADIDADAGINLVSTYFYADTDMFGVHDLVGDEVVVAIEVAIKAASTIPVSVATTTTTVITDDEITLAKALAELRSAKLPTTIEQAPTPTISLQQPSQLNVQDKGKGKMVEPEPVKKLSKKDQLMLDEELAFKLQAKRAEEKRNRPPTRSQQRSFICTYLKNMEGWKPKDLKNKSFVNIQELFDKAMKRVNTFVDYKTELVEKSFKKAEAEIAQESSSKRADTELEQESIKKQKVDEDKETAELQRLIEIVPDKEEVAIDAIPLATKPPSIVDYKIHKEGKKTYYQIIRANGSSKMYLVFSHMLKSFDKEDLETHGNWRIVGIKRLHDDLEVTAAKLMLLVYKLLLLVLEVNAASTKVTTAQRLRLLKEFLLSRDG